MKSLDYRLTVDNASFQRGMRSARGDVQSLNRSTSQANSGLRGITSSGGGAARALAGLAPAALGAGGALSILGSGLAAARIQLATVAQQDSLIRALRNLETTASGTTARLEELREVARTPGLGFEEAIQADVRLRSAGLSAELSTRSLKAFGNALASAGGGKAELDGVTLALQQIAAKGKVSAEEINQIAERVPQIRRAMQDAFGTADTEALQQMGINANQFIGGVIAELEKLPQATSGAQNSLDNFSDSWQALKFEVADFGTNASKGFVDSFSNMLGQARRDVASFRQFLGLPAASALGGEDDFSTKEAELRRRLAEKNGEAMTAEQAAQAAEKARIDEENFQFHSRIEAERLALTKTRAAAQEAAEKAAIERIKAAEEQAYAARLTREENLRRRLAAAQAAAPTRAAFDAQQDPTIKAGMAERLAEVLEIQRELNELERESAEAARSRAEAAADDAAARSRAAADFATETAILRAKVQGNEELAKSLQRQADLEQLKLRIMREQGLDAAQAGRLAQERVRLEQEAEKPRKRGKVRSLEESARARFNRLSPEEQEKVGGFEGFLEKNNTQRLGILAERRRKANEAGEGVAAKLIPGAEKPKDVMKTLEQTTAKIADKLDKIGTASV